MGTSEYGERETYLAGTKKYNTYHVNIDLPRNGCQTPITVLNACVGRVYGVSPRYGALVCEGIFPSYNYCYHHALSLSLLIVSYYCSYHVLHVHRVSLKYGTMACEKHI